ncbi:MAG: hypothetical protein A3J46_01740 [Candidatus Yanofskybacteria bacterium RIFCSPHIGHO2_02_FULL_41_11]|uniref:Ribose-5-phosphate isomerase n=1 Tax=Candidatus Yanofskybacteria bacterium RIFCSPHIGHO2_02_FULL_41_11 TaxID=1802675 RepID=A0A1F8FDK1_9BACT|nr:MAG: hypothetical protein A3J46_01740 [Candidatus Yanofskybacteria bacterium RIFCSPHIGHO2_02_FULL_41_11]
MIYLASDHRGFELKEKIKGWLQEWNYKSEDLGPFEYNKDDDYPDFAAAVGNAVALSLSNGKPSRGILVCGSGEGIAIAANKIDGIRAGTVMNSEQAKAGVHDEDMNVIALSSDFLAEGKAKEIVKSFVEAEFGNEERYNRRLEKIKNLEENN